MDFLKDDQKFEALAKDVFNTMDENENGYIEFSEMKRTILEMYKQVNVKQMNDEQIQDIINTFDQDENSILSQEELANLLRKVLEKSVQLQQEEEKKNKKKADKNEPTTFRSKKVTVKDREQQKQELKQLKEELNSLKKLDKKSQQLQNQKLVNYYVNPTARDEEVREQQQKFDASSKSLSIQSPHSSKSSISLNPLVFNQYLRQGFIKNADDMIKAQESAKANHLIGMAVKRSSAGEWQGLIDYFNDQTQKEFDRTPSSQQFHIIGKKLTKNVKFIMIHIQNLTYTNFRDLRISQKSELTSVDKPALFFWELNYNGQTFFKNSAKEFPNQLNECLDTVLIYNYTNPIQVILWKKQGKDSIYVGQFDITNSLFQLLQKVTDQQDQLGEQTKYNLNLQKINKQLRKLQSTEIKLYRKKRISYSNNSQEDPPLIGDISVRFQMFEICEFDAPLNQFSYTKGSPRSLEERERRMLVEQSKNGPYKWPDDQQNKALVIQINDAGIELAIVNEEDIQSYLDGQLGALIKETFYFDASSGSSRRTSRVKRPPLSENTMALLKSLDENPLVVQVNALRQTIRQGRLPKKVLEEALYQFGCSGSQLLIDHVDDMGMCEYDYCMDDGCYGVIIDTIQDMGFSNPENIQQADMFAEKLVQNIKSVLMEGVRIEPLFEFLKIAEKIPDFGITVNLMADQFKTGIGSKVDADGNVQIDPGSFISYFDINSRDFDKMENYEHIMVLGKLVKLSKKHLEPNDPFLQHIQQNYEEAKTKIYFTVPVLPKKKKLREKAKLLVLQPDNVHPGLFSNLDINKNTPLADVKQQFLKKKKEIQNNKENKDEEQDPVKLLEKPCLWNVCHELVRRKRWNMFYDGFQAEPLFYFQQGGTGNTPLMDFIEKGPFNVINQMVNQYHPNNPNDDFKDSPKLDPQKMFDMTTPQGKSFIHALALNQDINPIGQKQSLQYLLGLLEPQKQEELLISPMWPYDATPLVLYLTKLSSVVPAFTEEEIKSIQEILGIMKQPLKKQYSQSLFRAKCLFKIHNIEIEEDDDLKDYYINHIQVSKALALLQPGIFALVSQEIDWIQWFSLNIENYNSVQNELSFAIYNLARSGKIEFLEQFLGNFQKQQGLMPCQINPDPDFIISSNQDEFISDDYGQITIYDKDKNNQIKNTKEEMLNALASFYAKYPLEIFIGIQQILNETKFTSLKLNRILKELILQTIKMEPRILAKQFYQNQKSPYEELVKLGFEEELQKLLTPEQVQAYQEQRSDFAKNLWQEGLTGQLKNKENPLSLVSAQDQQQFFKYTSKLMTEKGLDDVLKFIDKLKQDNIEGRQDYIKKLLTQMARSLPTNFSKQQYPKIFKALRQNQNNTKSLNQQEDNFYKRNPQLLDRIKEVNNVNSYTMKQVLNAALNSKNQLLVNNCLMYLWNKSPDNVTSRNSSVLRPLYSKYGQYYRSLSYHPAVCLTQQEFDQYMADTKEAATVKDYDIAAKALTKYGLSDRLPTILKKLAANKPELVLNLLEDIALNQLEKQLLATPVPPLKPNSEQVQKVQPQFIIPTKRQIILSQYNLFDAGALGCLLQNAKKSLEKSANMPKSLNTYNHNLNKQAFQQYYSQKLRQNFFTQNPGTMYSNWNAPKPNIEKTVELILDALKDNLDNLLQQKPELKDKLEKISLLPLILSNVTLFDKLNNKENRIFTAIENIILQNLKQQASNLELVRIDKRMKMNLQFLEQNFLPTLKNVMEQEKSRSLRIFRALDYTLKKEQQPLQLQFATEVILIIVKNFVPEDFSGIFENNIQFLYNALAVSLMRSKTTDQRALEFMGSQLNKYEFYDLVHSLDLGEKNREDEPELQRDQQIKAGDQKKSNPQTRKQQIQEARLFRKIETLPQKSEIEPAIRLVVPSQNNIPYFIKLLKAKVKPFFKNYEKEIQFVNGEPFAIADLKSLNLFEYLIVKCHYTLISKHYININKPKSPLKEEQIIKYLCLASSSGSYTLFDLLSEQILNMKLSLLYKDYENKPELQVYLNLPIFYQVLTYSSEQSSIKYFENFIVDGVDLNLFYNWMKFNVKENEQNISKYNCFLPIITKKYGLLFSKIVQFLRKLLKNDKDYYEVLSEIMNNTNFSESSQQLEAEDGGRDQEINNQEISLTLLEYSIYQGFPDFCMIFDKNIILVRNPFEDKAVFEFLSNSLSKCSLELKQDDQVLINYCNKYEKEQGNYRIVYYKLYLMLKKYFEGNQKQLNSLQISLLLFKIMLIFKPDLNFLLNVNQSVKLTDDIQEIQMNKLLVEQQFFYLQLYGFDRALKYQTGIIDYVRKFHPKLKLFWVQQEVIDAFKTYFQFDYTKGLKTMEYYDQNQLKDQFEQFLPEVLLYVYYNQPDFLERNSKDTDQVEPFKQFMIYKYMLPIIRHQSTQEILQPIEQKQIKKKDLEQMVEKQQEFYNRVLEQLLVEDVELNFQNAAILVIYISTGNDLIDYVGEKDTAPLKIIPIINHLLERFSIQDLNQFILFMIFQIRNNDLYNIVMEWTQQSKAAINKDIFKEKSFIQGILNFLNARRKSENFNFNYQQNDLLRLFQFEFAKTDKMCKDKIYRGFCILSIVLNFISELEIFKQQIDPNDTVTINIELLENSKAKNSSLKVQSIKEITVDKELIGFNYQIEIPMIYQEKNNILNLQINPNILKEYQELTEKQRFENISNKQLQEELRNKQYIINSFQVQIAIKPNQLQADSIKVINEQLEEKYPFSFGDLYNNLVHVVDLDREIFYEDENNNKIVQRKNLTIEEEVNVRAYFDVKSFQYEITLNIQILKKGLFYQKCSRETQVKQLIDDYTKKQSQFNYIKKFLSVEGNNIGEYQSMMELNKEKINQKKQKSQLSDYEIEELKQLQEKYKKYQVPPYFVYELDWPIYIENNKITADEYNFPPLLFKKLISVIDGIFFETVLGENENRKSSIKKVFTKDQSFQINYISFIDTLVLQFAKIFELKSKTRLMQLSVEDVAYQALEWPFLKFIINLIKNKIQKSNLLFEMKESSKPEVQVNLPGIDECVQLSKTTYFYYCGMFVVRLGVFFNKKLLKLEKPEDQNLRYSQNFSLDFNLEPYINYIVNETQLKAVLKKENNNIQ
ncbi:unnamed protein product [Paramecium octaurelia]|uniref:EF-hand domain-containing protein n=1 Tax=Paramecium octaurelia TaxID=43137 RepID=A0A8S1Y6A6_PAROT|nr:unnamed protein product [Paramecium octaurelia]